MICWTWYFSSRVSSFKLTNFYLFTQEILIHFLFAHYAVNIVFVGYLRQPNHTTLFLFIKRFVELHEFVLDLKFACHFLQLVHITTKVILQISSRIKLKHHQWHKRISELHFPIGFHLQQFFADFRVLEHVVIQAWVIWIDGITELILLFTISLKRFLFLS